MAKLTQRQIGVVMHKIVDEASKIRQVNFEKAMLETRFPEDILEYEKLYNSMDVILKSLHNNYGYGQMSIYHTPDKLKRSYLENNLGIPCGVSYSESQKIEEELILRSIDSSFDINSFITTAVKSLVK